MERAVLGGSRQGARQRTASLDVARPHSRLAQYLTEQFRWGDLSLAQASTIARLSADELKLEGGKVPKDLQVLASLGAQGDHQQNIWRDLQRRVVKPWLQPEWCQVPLFVKNKHVVRSLPFFVPDRIFETMRVQKPDCFRTYVCQSTGSIRSFWSEVGSHPALLNHPVRQVQRYEERAVPVVLHGDGVPITALGAGQKSCIFISWRSLLCSQTSSKRSHMLICPVWSHHIDKQRGANTVDRIWHIVCESFDRALAEAPRHEGLFMVPVFCTGDLEWFNLAHGLPRWNSRNPCGCCPVSRQGMFNFKDVPAVRVDVWPDERRSSCHLFRRTLSPSGIIPDVMHTKHLGIDQRIAGSIVWMLIYQLMPGTPPENLAVLIEDLRQARARNQEGPGNLTPGMFLGKLSDEHCRETYPCLRAKAAETRGTIAALEQVFPRYMDGSEQRHIQAHLALQFSKRIDELLQRHGSWKPSPQEHEELMSCGLSMLLCMSSLTKAFLREGHCLFQLTFKCHWFLHSMELAQYLHPAYCWAYSGEDYMQKMKRLMQSCLRGRQPLSALGRFADQYAYALCWDMEKPCP